jgi:hypothetical protein
MLIVEPISGMKTAKDGLLNSGVRILGFLTAETSHLRLGY